MKRLIAVWFAIRKDIMFLFHTLISKDTETITKAVIIGMLIYVISPLDIIPDWIPFIGQIDDIGIVLFATQWVKKSVESTQRKQLHKGKVIDSKTIKK